MPSSHSRHTPSPHDAYIYHSDHTNTAEAQARGRKTPIVDIISTVEDPQSRDRSVRSASRAQLSRTPGMGNIPNLLVYPPSLLVTRVIPLPDLTTGTPIYIHPLLQYYPSLLLITYDFSLPHSMAQCPASRTQPGYLLWRTQPAMHPTTVGSLTIRMPGIERPVVALPSRRDTMVVTINDVLGAVSRAAREAVVYELSSRDRGDAFGLGRRGYVQPTPYYTEAQVSSGIRRRSPSGHWWGGLYPSRTERDVWDLHATEYGPP